MLGQECQNNNSSFSAIAEGFKNKAELLVNESFRVDGDNVRELSVVLCSYNVEIDKNGFVKINIPKEYSSVEVVKKKIIYLENIGESDINGLEVASADSKNVALISRSNIKKFVKNGEVSFRCDNINIVNM